MAIKPADNLKLGVFVTLGLIILVVTLYTLGRKQSLFGKTTELRARFKNISGLAVGNNVRFSGIQAGNVKKIHIINDTTIEVTMSIDDDVAAYVGKNAMVTIGNEGLMGNKVMNITPGLTPAPKVKDNDILQTPHVTTTEEMREVLAQTNRNLAVISEDLKQTVKQINEAAIWDLLQDSTLPIEVKKSLANIRKASLHAHDITEGINKMVYDAQHGKGAIGTLFSDPEASRNLKLAIANLQRATVNADKLTYHIDSLVKDIHAGFTEGGGLTYTLIKDTSASGRINRSIDNIEKGTAAFNEDMEALKHNFLLRGYFKKKEQQKEMEKRKEEKEKAKDEKLKAKGRK